jgi:hypothetical protein
VDYEDSWEKEFPQKRFYARRAFGSHRYHWDFGGAATPCGSSSPRGCTSDAMLEQFKTISVVAA